MIIGNGDIANVIKQADCDKSDIIFFASGVSNSACTNPQQFVRESELLLSMDRKKHLVYFSSLSIYYANTPYAHHKYRMENIVINNFDKFTVVRLGTITWGKNSNLLINFMKNKMDDDEPFEIQDTVRFVVYKNWFINQMDYVSQHRPKFLNIHGTRMTIQEIKDLVEGGAL